MSAGERGPRLRGGAAVRLRGAAARALGRARAPPVRRRENLAPGDTSGSAGRMTDLALNHRVIMVVLVLENGTLDRSVDSRIYCRERVLSPRIHCSVTSALQEYQDQDFQPVYFVAESFEDVKEKVR